MYIHQLNVEDVFLLGEITKIIYMCQSFGSRNWLIHIMFVYGHIIVWSQTNPKVWYKWFVDYISSIGFFQNKYDNSLFFYKKNTHMTHLLYVDNIIITTSTDDLWKSLISLLSSEFSMKYLWPLSYILGIDVTQHTVGLFLF